MAGVCGGASASADGKPRGVREAVVAPEQCLAHGDRRHADDAEVDGVLGGGSQCLLDVGIGDGGG